MEKPTIAKVRQAIQARMEADKNIWKEFDELAKTNHLFVKNRCVYSGRIDAFEEVLAVLNDKAVCDYFIKQGFKKGIINER